RSSAGATIAARSMTYVSSCMTNIRPSTSEPGAASPPTIELRGLPGALAQMPVEREAWAQWRDRVLVWRAGLLLDAEEHPDQRPAVLQLAAGDPLVFLCLFGCVLEP